MKHVSVVVALAVGFLAAVATAQQAPRANRPPPKAEQARPMTEEELRKQYGAASAAKPPPTDCDGQCKMMEDMCKAPCAKSADGKKRPPEVKQGCEANCADMVNVCKGSCREKGYLDRQYMLENMKRPKPPPGANMEDDH